MRRAAKTDRNQAEIVAALRKAGAGVCDLSAVGQGCPDLLVSYRGAWLLLEVKDGKKPPSARHLTTDQNKWHAQHRANVHIVTSVAGALEAIGAITAEIDRAEIERWTLDNIS